MGKAALGAALVLAIGLLVLALAPFGFLRGLAEQQLSARFGAPVSIAGIERLDHFTLHPRIRVLGVRVAQPAWAGTGDLARIDEAIIRAPLLSALRGALRPDSIDLRGVTLNLVRDEKGKANWEGSHKDDKSSSAPPRIAHLTVTNGRLTLKDAKRHMEVTRAGFAADPMRGLWVDGTGLHRGRPMTLSFRGAAIDNRDPNRLYPFRLAIKSPLLDFAADGQMDHPLDLDHFAAAIVSRGDNLKTLDDVIEAGLFGTQPFTLKARVRHDDKDWNIRSLAGTIGRSDMTGAAMVRKRDGRTLLDGHLDAGRLDFDDLSSNKGKARAAAKRRQIGPRVIPDTRIDLRKLHKLDGTLRVSARELLLNHPSLFKGFRGTLRLDHRRLTLDPLVIQLSRGTISGRMVVDHRGEGDPKLTLDLRQKGTRFADLSGDPAAIDGPVELRIALTGHGREIRSALANASGRVGLAMTGGTMQRKLAIFASGDVLKSIGQLAGGGDAAQVPVHCVIADFAARNGGMKPRALLLDTPVGRADGKGDISLANESLALLLSGRSKHPDPVQLAAKIQVGGTFSKPSVAIVNDKGKIPGKKGLFDKIGALFGALRTKDDEGRAAPAPAANCPALARDALR